MMTAFTVKTRLPKDELLLILKHGARIYQPVDSYASAIELKLFIWHSQRYFTIQQYNKQANQWMSTKIPCEQADRIIAALQPVLNKERKIKWFTPWEEGELIPYLNSTHISLNSKGNMTVGGKWFEKPSSKVPNKLEWANLHASMLLWHRIFTDLKHLNADGDWLDLLEGTVDDIFQPITISRSLGHTMNSPRRFVV
jgi:hypothetical protein